MQPADSTKPVVVREPYASKGARTVLWGGWGCEALSLPSHLLPLALSLLLAGCAGLPQPAQGPAVPALLLGEQHDAPEHQRQHREVIESLAARAQLAAVVLEMVEQGRSTTGLAPPASEEQVRQALAWNSQAWPWESYGPAVMAAVRAGVPVLGANLTRERMRSAMADGQLDGLLAAPVLRRQQESIRNGHCGLLPDSQIGPMTRVQIARDHAMAQAVAGAAVPGKTVVLLAGAGHVDPQVGVPLHLPARLNAKAVLLPPVATGKDYCAQLRQQMPAREAAQ